MKSDSDREVAIFTAALEVPLREREAIVERMCGGDENLRGKVDALLRAHDRVGEFLEEPPREASIE
jgi:hypothetical protein